MMTSSRSIAKFLTLGVFSGVSAASAMAATPETHFNKGVLQPHPVVQTGVKIDRNMHIERVFSQFVVRGSETFAAPNASDVKVASPDLETAPRPSPVPALRRPLLLHDR